MKKILIGLTLLTVSFNIFAQLNGRDQNGKRCSVNIEDGVELGVENSIAPVINYDDKVEQVYLDYNGKGVYSFDSDDSNSPWYGPRELSTLKFDEANGQIISYSLQRKGSLFSRAVNLKCKF